MNPIEAMKKGIIEQDWSHILTAYQLLTGVDLTNEITSIISDTEVKKSKKTASDKKVKSTPKLNKKSKTEIVIQKSGIEETVSDDGMVFITDHNEPRNPDFIKPNNKQYRPEAKKIPCNGCGKEIYRSDAAKFSIGSDKEKILCVKCLRK